MENLPATARRPFLLPRDLPAPDKLTAFWRCVAAEVLAEIGRGPREEILRQRWPKDAVTTRAASAPATTTTSGWASQLASVTVRDLLTDLAPRSGAAQLFERSALIELGSANSVTIPVPSSTLAPSFVAEGSPIPVVQDTFASATLGPTRKLAFIEAFTVEIERSSAQVLELIVRRTMTEAAARQLDAAVFSATAADSTRPAGILNGVTGTTATAGGGINALATDVRNLANSIAAAGYGGTVLYFTSVGAAETMRIHASALADRVIGVPAIASGTVIAVNPNAVATGYRGEPEVSAVRETVLVMDTAPAQLATGAQGSGVVGSPARSLWQTNSVASRLVLRVAWTALPGAVQFVTSTTW